MKRRMLDIITALALCLSFCPAWAFAAEGAGDEAPPQLRAIPEEINMLYENFVFAQGVPIVIEENGAITSIYDEEGTLLSDDTDVSSCSIYGGWFDGAETHAASTSIVMESGTVKDIFGGSFSGTLDGNTNITLNGGTVANVFGGGNQSSVTGTAYVTVNDGAKVWGAYPDADKSGIVYGGGCMGAVSHTEVVFNGGDVSTIYGGGQGYDQLVSTCGSTLVRFMGQADDVLWVYGGSNIGTVGTAVVEFHGSGESPSGQSAYICGSGWNDRVDRVEMIIGRRCAPPAASPVSAGFSAKNPDENSGSSVGSASFDVSVDFTNPSMMNSSGLDGTGVEGKVTASIHADKSMDTAMSTELVEIDELSLDGVNLRYREDGMNLDRLYLSASASFTVPAKQGVALRVQELAGSGCVYFERSPDTEVSITPITVDSITVPEGARIRVDRLADIAEENWLNAALFTGPGVAALDNLDCLACVNDRYALVQEGDTIRVRENSGTRQAFLDPVPLFDRADKTYRYGETIQVTMGLKCGGQPLAGRVVSVVGGASGTQSFATGVTDENGMAVVSVPVNDAVWNSLPNALSGYFAGTAEYAENRYAVCSADGNFDYTIQPAQVTLSEGITAPVRGAVPVRTLPVSGDAVCIAEVLWSPEDAVFRPEVAYTASIRLVPKPGYGLDSGQLGGSVTYEGQPLPLPGTPEADGSLVIPNVETFASIPAIRVTGVTLDRTSLSLRPEETFRLTAAITPANADNQSMSWTSDNPAAVTVDRGEVTAVGVGTATITVTTADGARTAVCTVTVKEATILPDPPAGENGEQFRLVMETGISEVPAELQSMETLNTPERLETAMRTEITRVVPGIPQANTAVYDVTLLVSRDGGRTWEAATSANFPRGGLTVTLPYPEGTDSGYRFTVVHMFTSTAFGKIPGETENPAVTNTAAGIRFTVTGLSPISVGWTRPSAGDGSTGGSGGGGSWSSDAFAVTVERPEHGKVTSNRTNAGSNSTVTLTVAPDSGYVLDTLTVTDSRGNEIKLTAQGGGKYTFTMPGRAVTVKATFAPLPDNTQKPCDGGPDCPSRGFTDLGGVGTWYHEAVDYVLRNGLMNGYSNGTFGPNDTLTRAQFAQILFNKEGRPVVNYLLQYGDVAEGAWYTEAVRWAASRGIIGGYGNGLFGPNDDITREQLAVMLWRYAGSPAAEKELHFTDADQAGDYALEALRWAVENGVMSGKGGGTLDPQGPATRAQAAQMLKNSLENRP